VEPVGERKGAYRVWVGKHERKRQIRRPRRSCEDNSKVDLTKNLWQAAEWIDLP
jgi:hypothetical protein